MSGSGWRLRRTTDSELGRVAGTKLGRAALSILMACFCVFLVVWNLPSSEIRGAIRPGLRPVVEALALDQDWGVFAPNPTTVSIAVEADVELADGTVVHYEFPDGDPFIGAYREFRWRKFERLIRQDDSSGRYWRRTAEWIAARYADDDPVRVTLIRYFATTPEPDAEGDAAVKTWDSHEFFTLRFDETDGEGA